MLHGFCGTFRSITVIEVDGDDGELWHVLSNFMLCSVWQNYNFFSLLNFFTVRCTYLNCKPQRGD